MRRNSYLNLIKNLYREFEVDAAVERLLEPYRYPGAPLHLIARNLGVSDIIEEDLPFDGGIFEQGKLTIIKVNALSAINRQRFTLAHELGHLIFMQRFSLSGECRDDAQLERACDRLAVELLMPRRECVAYVGGLGTASPENLRVFAARFDVSLQVAARRLEDLKLWNRSIGLWQYHEKPRELWFVGKKLWHRPPNFTAFDLARTSSVSVSTIETLQRGEYSLGIVLQMLSLGRNFFLGLINTGP